MAVLTGPYLVDTSILIRLDDPQSPVRQDVLAALQRLMDAGNSVHLAPQNLVEFWGVATRPRVNNGLGMTPAQAAARLITLKVQFDVLPENATLYPEWERLATAAQVSGKQVHDTRLVAYMVVHGIPNLLTLNAADFRRFQPLTGINVVEPGDI